MMSVPHRYDLAMKSCEISEINMFNRKLKKHKLIDNRQVIEVNTDRELLCSYLAY